MLRECSKCQEMLDVSEFHRCTKGGLQAQCKNCKKESSLITRRKKFPVSVSEKECTVCHKVLDASKFSRNPHNSTGLDSPCKNCVRDRHYQRTYGISLAEYEVMLEEQGHCCQLCNIPQINARDGRLQVDHDHDTGRVRGLLCGNCNTALGLFHDDPEALAKAIIYLTSN